MSQHQDQKEYNHFQFHVILKEATLIVLLLCYRRCGGYIQRLSLITADGSFSNLRPGIPRKDVILRSSAIFSTNKTKKMPFKKVRTKLVKRQTVKIDNITNLTSTYGIEIALPLCKLYAIFGEI